MGNWENAFKLANCVHTPALAPGIGAMINRTKLEECPDENRVGQEKK